MRAIAMIIGLGLALGWSNAAFSESSLSGSASETLKASESEYVNQSKSRVSLNQQKLKLSGTEMQSQKLTATETKTPGNTFSEAGEAGKQVDAKFSNLASSSVKQQQSSALSATDVSLRDLSSSPAASLNKSGPEGMMNKLD